MTHGLLTGRRLVSILSPRSLRASQKPWARQDLPEQALSQVTSKAQDSYFQTEITHTPLQVKPVPLAKLNTFINPNMCSAEAVCTAVTTRWSFTWRAAAAGIAQLGQGSEWSPNQGLWLQKLFSVPKLLLLLSAPTQHTGAFHPPAHWEKGKKKAIFLTEGKSMPSPTSSLGQAPGNV